MNETHHNENNSPVKYNSNKTPILKEFSYKLASQRNLKLKVGAFFLALVAVALLATPLIANKIEERRIEAQIKEFDDKYGSATDFIDPYTNRAAGCDLTPELLNQMGIVDIENYNEGETCVGWLKNSEEKPEIPVFIERNATGEFNGGFTVFTDEKVLQAERAEAELFTKAQKLKDWRAFDDAKIKFLMFRDRTGIGESYTKENSCVLIGPAHSQIENISIAAGIDCADLEKRAIPLHNANLVSEWVYRWSPGEDIEPPKTIESADSLDYDIGGFPDKSSESIHEIGETVSVDSEYAKGNLVRLDEIDIRPITGLNVNPMEICFKGQYTVGEKENWALSDGVAMFQTNTGINQRIGSFLDIPRKTGTTEDFNECTAVGGFRNGEIRLGFERSRDEVVYFWKRNHVG